MSASTGFLIGAIFGFFLGVAGVSFKQDDQIKAGVFEKDGVAYKIERAMQ